ncbi:hypothetical protein B0H14DRAFT_2589106 [Mycena olivaceomarginata]|nr:hypothetical protein B0H14DRAFT_2589106 [Mycena olivaceomarginata]
MTTLQSYCVGINSGCEGIYTVESGDTCGAIESRTGVSDAQLQALNPWMGFGQNLCIKNSNVAHPTGPPANLNPGSWTNVQSGDNCNGIESNNSPAPRPNIPFMDFLTWNTEVSKTCSSSFFVILPFKVYGHSPLDLNLALPRRNQWWLRGGYILSDIQSGHALCIKNPHVSPPPSGSPANLNPGGWSKSIYCLFCLVMVLANASAV